MKKGDFLLIFALLALSFTYFLSFPISKKKEEKRESVKTSLINPKNAEKITHQQIFSGNKTNRRDFHYTKKGPRIKQQQQ